MTSRASEIGATAGMAAPPRRWRAIGLNPIKDGPVLRPPPRNSSDRPKESRMYRVLALAAVAIAFSAVPAGATTPGHNGRITFMRAYEGAHWQTWVADSRL